MRIPQKQNKTNTNTQMPDEFWDEWRLVTGALRGALVPSRADMERWRKELRERKNQAAD